MPYYHRISILPFALLFQVVCLGQFHDILQFSVRGGIYEEIPSLSITHFNPDFAIHYTTDGTLPNVASAAYLGESLYLDEHFESDANIYTRVMSPSEYNISPKKEIQKCIIISAASFNELGERQSEYVIHSYFIHSAGIDHHQLPIISIATDRENLFDFETGIFVPGIHWTADNSDWTGNYYMNGMEWERPSHVEMYEPNGSLCFSQSCGLRTHGGNSRRFEQKGMKIYARSDYGASHFEYPVFPQKSISAFKRLALKPISASWSQAGIENFISNSLALQTNIDVTAMRPVVVYLNGEYWGIYFLTERIDDDYLEENHHIEVEEVDIIADWNGLVEEGNNENFLQLIQFIEDADFTDPSDYDRITQWIDLPNFIDYQIMEIYLSNIDWPTNNMKCWRQRIDGEKWRWILFDGDGGLQYHRQLDFSKAVKAIEFESAKERRARLLFRKLLKNDAFKQLVTDRLNSLLLDKLNISHSTPVYYEIYTLLESEIQNQSDRFLYPQSKYTWKMDAEQSKYFLSLRQCEIKSQVLAEFDIPLEGIDCDDSSTEVENLSIYPNPSQAELYIQFDADKNTFGTITIFNVHNQVLLQQEISILKDKNTLDFSNNVLPNGLYFFRIQSKNSDIYTKFIVER